MMVSNRVQLSKMITKKKVSKFLYLPTMQVVEFMALRKICGNNGRRTGK